MTASVDEPVETPEEAGADAQSFASRAAAFGGVWRNLATGLVSLAIVLVLWWVLLWAFDVSPYVGKGPLDVFAYLFLDEDAGEHLGALGTLLGETLVDAAIGFVTGLALAIVIAALFMLSRGVEAALMPVAMLFRSVPLIAMAPVLILIFGRQGATVAAMGAIVVLFPALVTIVTGLRSASKAMTDVVTVYGGGTWKQLRLVAFPSSLPSFFAAVRISIPGAITGALLAEWLATGRGLGYGIVSAIGRARISEVWADVVAITLVSIVLYNLALVVETAVLKRRS
ncbi:ABC transporter permease [Agromyces archimandritae]|uniref:ABC transporter permease subunit n=1 Tax=Agromyces archimandritae TaxID=2781962 RepID=A0A975IPP2_9MICO|nr:ABC transporter permease subunit [Agromyces archimandritae]QTX05827.1 ABC transporter permease subunit [Agromyces archimandritae]